MVKMELQADCSSHSGTQGVACDVNYLIYYSYVIIEMKYAALCDHETKQNRDKEHQPVDLSATSEQTFLSFALRDAIV